MFWRVPVLDTVLAFMRRWVNRRPLFSADRHHFHHQLVARGLSIKKTVVVSYGLAFGFVFLGSLDRLYADAVGLRLRFIW